MTIRKHSNNTINNIIKKNHLTPNIALKSGSLNRNGIFDTCRRFGWSRASLEELLVNNATVVATAAAVDAADAEAIDDVVTAEDTACGSDTVVMALPIMLLLTSPDVTTGGAICWTVCDIVSVSVVAINGCCC